MMIGEDKRGENRDDDANKDHSKEAAASKEEIEEGKGTDDNLNEAIKSKDTEICHIYTRINRFLQAFQ